MKIFQCLVFLVLFLLPVSVMAQWITQDIDFNPGWNTIYLEMDPEPGSCDQIFSGQPVASVWQWNRRFSAIDFEVDPNTLVPDDPHWLVWFSPTATNAFLTRLFNMTGGCAYLVKVPSNTPPFTLSLKGRPGIAYYEWFPHAINLVGLPVNPASEPSFTDFFRHTPSVDTTRGYENELYKLNASGDAERIVVPARENIKAGTAYWIGCAARPASPAPLNVDIKGGLSVDFGAVLLEQDVSIRNASDIEPIEVKIRQLSSETPPTNAAFPELAGDVPLSFFVYDATNTTWNWKTLSVGQVVTQTLAPGGEWLLRLGVRRNDFPVYIPVGTNGALYQSVLEIVGVDDSILYHIGISAENELTGVGNPISQDISEGLWVGDVNLYEVNCPAYSSTNLLPTDSVCTFRLLVHVDNTGHAQLLQEVFMAWTPLSDTNGEYRLYADRQAIPDDAEEISRISSVAFPFMEPSLMAGSMSNQLTTTVTVDCNDPLNPYLHRYNPLHDNKDWNYNTYTNPVETLTISRIIALDFTTGVSSNVEEHPLWGVSQTGGTYTETLTGLREQPIITKGTFFLNRISLRKTIND